VNFIELVRIGKDAVVRSTAGGKLVTGFSAAFDSGWGENKKTIWLDCSAWGDRFENVAPYLLKGSLVMVCGDIGTREHEGKTYITLDVKDIKLTGKPQSDQSSAARQPAPRSQPTQTNTPPNYDNFDEKIPF
jgi:single-strand DNA-binding protein